MNGVEKISKTSREKGDEKHIAEETATHSTVVLARSGRWQTVAVNLAMK